MQVGGHAAPSLLTRPLSYHDFEALVLKQCLESEPVSGDTMVTSHFPFYRDPLVFFHLFLHSFIHSFSKCLPNLLSGRSPARYWEHKQERDTLYPWGTHMAWEAKTPQAWTTQQNQGFVQDHLTPSIPATPQNSHHQVSLGTQWLNGWKRSFLRLLPNMYLVLSQT